MFSRQGVMYMAGSEVGTKKKLGILRIYVAFEAIRLDDFGKFVTCLCKLGENVEGSLRD